MNQKLMHLDVAQCTKFSIYSILSNLYWSEFYFVFLFSVWCYHGVGLFSFLSSPLYTHILFTILMIWCWICMNNFKPPSLDTMGCKAWLQPWLAGKKMKAAFHFNYNWNSSLNNPGPGRPNSNRSSALKKSKYSDFSPIYLPASHHHELNMKLKLIRIL